MRSTAAGFCSSTAYRLVGRCGATREPSRYVVRSAARSCGRLTRRFAELREGLPSGFDPEIDLCTGALQQVLDHHILLLKTSLGFLAGAGRSERLAERLDAVDGLGHPARRLEAIRFDILWRTSLGI
jgi:hypothetical protein